MKLRNSVIIRSRGTSVETRRSRGASWNKNQLLKNFHFGRNEKNNEEAAVHRCFSK